MSAEVRHVPGPPINTLGVSATALLRARWRIAESMGSYPNAYFALYRIAGGASRLCVRRDTEIVIEGFPRSANTFALNAFRIAQQNPGHVAHHLHSPAQVIRAVRWDIPALVLIREPLPAAASFVIRHPHFSTRSALRSYIRFYQGIDRYLERVVVADFQQVVHDFGAVVGRVNERFGTTFARFDHNPDNVRRCFEQMNRWQRRNSAAEEVSRKVTHPDADRRCVAEAICHQIAGDETMRSLVDRADAVYRRVAAFTRSNGDS